MGLFAGPIDGFCVLSREALYTIAFNEGPLEESASDPRSVGLGQGPENLTFDGIYLPESHPVLYYDSTTPNTA